MTPALMAERLYSSRRARDEAFGADGFGEPAWDMLLWVCAHEGDGTELTVGAVLAAGVTRATIAAPYLDWLVTRDLVTIGADRVGLSERGRAKMAEFADQQESIGTQPRFI